MCIRDRLICEKLALMISTRQNYLVRQQIHKSMMTVLATSRSSQQRQTFLFFLEADAPLDELLLSRAVLALGEHGQELGEDSDPGLDDLLAPLLEHRVRQVEHLLGELIVQDLNRTKSAAY